MSIKQSIAVLGAGAWGTALAITAARAGLLVTLIGRDVQEMNEAQRTRLNQKYLPNITLPADIFLTAEKEKLKNHNIILVVVPAQQLVQALSGSTRLYSS